MSTQEAWIGNSDKDVSGSSLFQLVVGLCASTAAVAAVVLVVLLIRTAPEGEGAATCTARSLSLRLGSVHWSPCYFINASVSVLIDGAQQVLDMHSKVIKIAVHDPATQYKWNANWSTNLRTPLQILQTAEYRRLIEMDFRTIIMVVFTSAGDNYYINPSGLQQRLSIERNEIREAAEHLLSTYPTGKTFIFQNWEGDWAVRGNFNISQPPTPDAIEGMKQWYVARQDGVDIARRNASPNSTVSTKPSQIFHAAEVNLVKHAIDNPAFPETLNSVIPFIKLDMVSYSNYDTYCDGQLFNSSLKFIGQRHNRSAVSPTVSTYIGEVGMPLMRTAQDIVQKCTKTALLTALTFGVPYVTWWEMFNNECTNRTLCPDGNCRSASAPVFNEQYQPGFWLVMPNGTSSWPRKYMMELIQNSSEVKVPC